MDISKQIIDIMQNNGYMDALDKCLEASKGQHNNNLYYAVLDCMGNNGYSIEYIADDIISHSNISLDTLDDMEQGDYNLTNLIKSSLSKHRTVAQAIIDGLIQYYSYFVKQVIRDIVSKGV